jgi:predicted DCC family thiol-disulfide oxidoreductase YuxK
MSSEANKGWQLEVFFDGECPLCLREIKLLRRLDRKHRIRFTDIEDTSFSPAGFGMTMKDFMDEIRGRLPSGEWITGVEVFRRLYAAVGLKPVVALTRLPGISHGLEFGYRVFAKNRLRLTGRCDDGTCKVN